MSIYPSFLRHVGGWIKIVLGWCQVAARVTRASLNPGYKSVPYHEAILGEGLIVVNGKRVQGKS